MYLLSLPAVLSVWYYLRFQTFPIGCICCNNNNNNNNYPKKEEIG
jgi:NOL1/NOP2/fmu family ribosome biogenesis protein